MVSFVYLVEREVLPVRGTPGQGVVPHVVGTFLVGVLTLIAKAALYFAFPVCFIPLFKHPALMLRI